MHMEDTQRLVTEEIEMLNVVLYLVCRKRQQGIQPEIIDILQGRIGKNIFLRHYLTPSSTYEAEVLKALEKLQQQLYLLKC
jgi:intergrase/recombinase